MKIKEDVLKQLLTKIGQLESRIISLEGSIIALEASGNSRGIPTPIRAKGFPNDYCHADFIKASYPTYQSIVYCECDKCSKVRKPKDFK